MEVKERDVLFNPNYDKGEPNLSPGGFGMQVTPNGTPFGVEGWHPPPQQVSGITFYLDGTATVHDQRGMPVRGVEANGKPVYFAMSPPSQDNPQPGHRVGSMVNGRTTWVKLATHAEVVAALAAEGIDWLAIRFSGWPQLPYDVLRKLPTLPAWPFAEEHMQGATGGVGVQCTCVRCCIRDKVLRQDALRVRREAEESRKAEAVGAEE